MVWSCKTALSHVPSIFASHVSCLVGTDPQWTRHFSVRPAELIFTSQRGGITLQMLALPHQMRCLSLIETCGTICLSGVTGGLAAAERKSSVFSSKSSL
jgi:hypothetical protein